MKPFFRWPLTTLSWIILPGCYLRLREFYEPLALICGMWVGTR
jgi:hypothetical protein